MRCLPAAALNNEQRLLGSSDRRTKAVRKPQHNATHSTAPKNNLWKYFRPSGTNRTRCDLERFQAPTSSNLFVFVAPNIPFAKQGLHYQKDHLVQSFSNAYAAFSSIAAKKPNAVIHTGNWGCGAFGGDPKTMALLQLAAAQLAGVKELRYYAMDKGDAFRKAAARLQQIFAQHPE